jgi:hypothetical protein
VIRRLSLLLFLLIPSTATQAEAPSRKLVIGLISGDQCEAVAGYAEFRTALKKALHDRDAAALQRLFHPRGSMRVQGVHMTAIAGETDPARLEPVWNELSDILQRGCARNGARLILPGIARLAEENLATETLIVIRPTWLHKRPAPGSRAVRLGMGRMLTEIVHDDRWTRVQIGNLQGYVPTSDVRNPHDTRIEAERVDGRWTIIEFGSGV